MNDEGTGKMTPRYALHSFPGPPTATTLTAASKYGKPVSSDLVDKTTDAVTVAGNGVIIQPAPHHTPQPTTRFADRPVHSLSQISLDLP